jgi:DNA polymerase (family 10)
VKRIRDVQKRYAEITILAGTECDILPDGSMDYPDDVLADLDIVIGAVHSRLSQEKSEMTRRICAALANPYVKILAHPTGRRLGEREPYEVDLDQVFKTAERHGKAVEINASARADLSDVNARRAAELGATIAVSTDAHQLDDLANIELGLATARRAWLEPSRVINTWPTAKLLDWARSRVSDARTPRAGRRRP